ncbi:MAG: hypothetical protein Kow0047_09690 [Anaerolineae bacterium]
MAVQQDIYEPYVVERVEALESPCRAGIPWWAILLASAIALFLLSLWSVPVWADSGATALQDEVPGWIIGILFLGGLAGIRGLVASHHH